MKWFKVWSADRSQKRLMNSIPNINALLLKASEMLGYQCTTLVLEVCGTVINDDSFLEASSLNEIFMALQQHEFWTPSILVNEDLSQQRLNTSIGVLNDRETLASPDSSFNQIFLLEPQPSTSRSFSSEEVRQETSTPIGNSGTSKRALREKFLGYAGVVIPWSRLDSDCLNALEEKKRLSATQLTKVCQMVVDEIRLTGYYVPCKVFHETAKSMCQQFPDTFIEKDDDDIIIGNGYLGLAEKLRNRNNYLNQPHKTKFDDQLLHKQIKTLKADNNACSGNINNQPNIFSQTDESLNPLNDGDSFALIRRDINEKMELTELLNKWEILKTKDGLFEHFKNLTETDIQTMTPKLRDKYSMIYFACMKEEFEGEKDLEKLIKAICHYFKEDADTILQHREINSQNLMTAHPGVYIIENTGDHMIFYKGQEIQKGANIWEAFEIMFAMYYIFNECFPREIACTLEFFQRYVLKIHPTDGTKNMKRSVSKCNMKVLGLMKKIKK
ncbi:uncharacterized protein LOC129807796 [Phlebotomus papatasi]|uniref:uncharacterized protein LOC129807796 n=1 Tax=Phlebotomus papatasi TaxID=29031 RepID=UPI00248455BC|nr:uncharacterized protein LOC129807796 [Phlebotomus papatasi]